METALAPITQSLTQSTAIAAPEEESRSTLNAIDFDNFLLLLTAQLRNQDPLDPIDSADF